MLRGMWGASGCRGRRYFLGLAADSRNGCCEPRVVRNQHPAAAAVGLHAAAADAVVVGGGADGDDDGWTPSFRCR